MAGKQGNIWYFGDLAGVTFNTLAGGHPTVLSDSIVNTREGVATISDPDGNLLFYTDGIDIITTGTSQGSVVHEVLSYHDTAQLSRVYIDADKDANEYQGTYWDLHPTKSSNQLASNLPEATYVNTTNQVDYVKSTGLFGDWSSSQSAVIVPRPLSDSEIKNGWREPFEYIIFTVPAKTGAVFQTGDRNQCTGNGLMANDYNSGHLAKSTGLELPTNGTKSRAIAYCRGKRKNQHGILHYSVIDLRYNNAQQAIVKSPLDPDANGKPQGKGVITKRNRPVGFKVPSGIKYTRVSEKIAAVGADDGGVWVASRLCGDGDTSGGIQITKVTTNGVQSNANNRRYLDGYSVYEGLPSSGSADRNQLGYMRFSPDGARLAMSRADGYFLVYDFNTTTGVVDVSASTKKSVDFSNNGAPVNLSTNPNKYQWLWFYGLEIVETPNDASTDYIYYLAGKEYDRGQGNREWLIIAIKDAIFSGATKNWDTNTTTFQNHTVRTEGFKTLGTTSSKQWMGLQLGSNGNIYIARPQEIYLDAITTPANWDTSTIAVNAVTLTTGTQSRLGLPTFISSFFNACATFYIRVTGHTDASTYGGTDGDASAGSYGATGTTNYKWFDGASNDTGKTTRVATGLSADTYTVSGNTILDGQTCTSETTITIDEPGLFGNSAHFFCEDGCDMEFGSVNSGGVYFTALTNPFGSGYIPIPDKCTFTISSGIVTDPKPSYELTAGCCEIDACDKMIEFKFTCKEEDDPPPPPPIECFNECVNHEMFEYNYSSNMIQNPTNNDDRGTAINIINKLVNDNQLASKDLISLQFVKHFDIFNITDIVKSNWGKIFDDPFSTQNSSEWVVGCTFCPPKCGYYFIGGITPYLLLQDDAQSKEECSVSSQGYPADGFSNITDINKDYPASLTATTPSSETLFNKTGIFEQNIDYIVDADRLNYSDGYFTAAKREKIQNEGIVLFSDHNGCLCAAKVSNYIKIHDIVKDF